MLELEGEAMWNEEEEMWRREEGEAWEALRMLGWKKVEGCVCERVEVLVVMEARRRARRVRRRGSIVDGIGVMFGG